MLIASKRKNQFMNTDDFSAIFVNDNKRIIGASVGGRNNVLDEYESREAALKAMEILISRLQVATEKTIIVCMPSDTEVETALIGNREHYRHIDGRKTKGHGGS